MFAFLSDQRSQGYRLFLGHPDEDTQREVVFLDLPDPEPALAPVPNQSPDHDEILSQIVSGLDQLAAAMITPESSEATTRALRASGNRRSRSGSLAR